MMKKLLPNFSDICKVIARVPSASEPASGCQRFVARAFSLLSRDSSRLSVHTGHFQSSRAREQA